MSTAADIDPEMRRRFDAAEKIRIHETPLARPALQPTEESLRAHFESEVGRAQRELENPHFEPRVSAEDRARAVPASILLAIVMREREPTVLVTRRHHGISFPGHWVFPGGRQDDADASPLETALREAEEEIGLARRHVDVLGRLGDYVSHSGFRVAPTVALVRPPFDLTPHPGEVDEIDEIPLAQLVSPSSYFLFRFQDRPDRAHFALEGPREGLMLTGVTVSIAIGFYDELLRTHAREDAPPPATNR
jgi:8-oxo-dGTP pyrophosphatase MutT (NUDIX family)